MSPQAPRRGSGPGPATGPSGGRRRSRSIVGSPVLIGAVTTLIVLVAVFLAYNANNGLPFTPSYTLKVDLPDAANLVKGNDVRIAGTRIGSISAIAVKQNPHTGAVNAQLTVNLQTNVGPLPADTTALVRSRSALGLKYLQLTPGTSSQTLPTGSTLPIANARPAPVEIDQVFNTFDAPTRAAIQTNLITFGNAFAGRGGNINSALGALAPALGNLIPVARYLAAPSTRTPQLFVALERAASQVAPVAETQAALFRDLDITFGALAGVTPELQRSIELGAPALNQATSSFKANQPFIAKSTEFFRLLRPSAAALRGASPSLAHAFTVGATNLRAATALNDRVTVTLRALANFAQDPVVALGLSDLTQTATVANPIVADLAGSQTVCNYTTLFFRNIASLLSEGDSVGTWQRFTQIVSPAGPNNEGAPASAPANGPDPTPGTLFPLDNHLHNNPYPNVAAPGQPRQCEAGNEVYAAGQTVLGHPAQVGNGRDFTTRQKGLG